MKLKRTISLLLTLVMLLALAPTAAFADGGGETVYHWKSSITVHAGESISLWDSDQSGGKKAVTVEAGEGCTFDAVFPRDEKSASALSYYTQDVSFTTSSEIKPDKNAAGGMLIWISVTAGEAVVNVHTVSHPDDIGLYPYAAEGSPLKYAELTKDIVMDCALPEDCSLEYITLVLFGTNGAEAKRVVDENGNDYDLFGFTRDSMSFSQYTNGAKTDMTSVPIKFGIARDLVPYFGTTVLIPASETLRHTGTVKVVGGSVICAVPRIEAPRPATRKAATRGGTTPLTLSQEDCFFDAVKIKDKEYGREASGYVIAQDLVDKLTSETGEVVQKASSSGDKYATAIAVGISDSKHPECLSVFDSSGIYYNAFGQDNGVPLSNDSDQTYFEMSVSLTNYNIMTTEGDGSEADVPALTVANKDESFLGENISVTVIGGTADRSTAQSGDTITVTATVPQGMRFVRWKSTVSILDASAPETIVTASGNDPSIIVKAIYEPIGYSVTESAGDGGAIAADKEYAAMGDEVRVTVTPDPGYEIASVSAYGDGAIDVTPDASEPNVFTFTMPAHAVTVTATFQKPAHAVTATAENGTLSADRQSAPIGETVTLTLAPQDGAHYLGSLSVRSGGANVPTTKVNDTTYTFTMPAGDVTASALFVADYLVRFENWNGELLAWSELTTGQTPAYTGATPAREQDERYSYTFAGWDREFAPVSGGDTDIVYTATFTATPRTYAVTFCGADGSALQTADYTYGATPVYTGATPTKAADGDYIYTFTGWDREPSEVTGETYYTATFSAVPVLKEGANPLSFGQWDEQTFPFTPETSGYYRFRSIGDAIHAEPALKDGAGDEVDYAAFAYHGDRDMHFELVAWLEAGETYSMTLTTHMSSGDIYLLVANVDMHTVRIDTNTAHGTVECEGGTTFLAYTGQVLQPFGTPDPGYGVLTLTATDANGKRLMERTDGGYFMPDCDLFVTATFAEAHEITVDSMYGVTQRNNEAVFDEWIEDDEEDYMVSRAAVGANVEYCFRWDAGCILSEFSIKTASGADVEFSHFEQYLNKIDVWFTMPDEPITVTVKIDPLRGLVFDPGEADGDPIPIRVQDGLEFALPNCPYDAPDGKAFLGWSLTVGDGAAEQKTPGAKVTLTANGTATALYGDIVYGDADWSGVVDLSDAIALLRYLANYDDATGRSSSEVGAGADADASGDIELDDAILLLQYLANYDDATGTSSVVLGPQS